MIKTNLHDSDAIATIDVERLSAVRGAITPLQASVFGQPWAPPPGLPSSELDEWKPRNGIDTQIPGGT